MAIAESAGLLFRIRADSSQASAQVKKFKEDLGGIEKASKDTISPLQQMAASSGLSAEQFTAMAGTAAVATAAITAIAAGAVAGTAALFKLAQSASEFGSQIFDLSQKTGLSAVTLSSLKVAADQSGTSIEKVGTSVAKFAKTVGEAADGSDKAVVALKRFGLEPQDAIDDLDGALGKVFTTIAQAKSGVDQMTLAQAAFGRGGADLIPMIRSFDGDLEGLIATAKELGVTLTDEDAAAADEFGDQLDTLTAQLAAVGRMIGFEVMPVFMEFATSLSQWLSRNKGEIRSWAEATGTAFDYAVKGVSRMSRALAALANRDMFALGEVLAEVQRAYDPAAMRQDGVARRNKALLDSIGNDNLRKVIGKSTTFDGESEEAKKKAAGSGVKKDDRTDRQAYQDFVTELKKVGIVINSGFRTFKEQAALFKRLGPGEAARPGTSDHEFYRAVDLDPNADQALVEEAARRARVILDKRNVHKGTGLHNHQGFRKGVREGGGEAELAKEQEQRARDKEREREEEERGVNAAIAEMLRDEQQASAARLAIRREEAALAVQIIQSQVEEGQITELEGLRRLQQLKLDMLKEEEAELQGQTQTLEVQQKLDEVRLKIQAQEVENAREITKAEKERFNQRNESWKRHIENLEKEIELQDRLAEEQARQNQQRMMETTVGSGGEISALGQLNDYFAGEGNTAALAGLEALQTAFEGVANAVGKVVEAYVLYGTAGASVREVTAMILAQIAQQAAVKAIFELAEGFAALAMSFFGIPNAGPSAAAHFAAAAIYGSIAAVAAVAGRAVAGDSFSKQAGGRGASSSAQDQEERKDPRVIRRESEDAFTSGRGTVFEQAYEAMTNAVDLTREAVNRNTAALSTFETAPAGAVVQRGIGERPGLIGKAAVNDIGRNSGLANQMARNTRI